jgi:hypothetical protein
MSVKNMSSVASILGGQWFITFTGEQSGNGFLSFNKFGSTGGYGSLYQEANPIGEMPHLLLQGRISVTEVTDVFFSAIANRTNKQTPGAISLVGRRSDAKQRWTGEWKSTDKFSGTFELVELTSRRLEGKNVRVIEHWNEFSDWAFSNADNVVYRGLGSNSYHLESTAQRAGIFDLHHYLDQMLPRVRAELLKRHGLRINLSAPDELAEVLALIRHHGFPSPIMDWSKSPWVALYFAVMAAKTQASGAAHDTFCRVCCMRHSGISVVEDVQKALLAPHLLGALTEIPTPMTSRVTAQEGVFLLMPCIDVVTPLVYQEQKNSTLLIDAIDIPYSLLDEFERRLDQMMINEATMLSSIDSTLRGLRKKLITH